MFNRKRIEELEQQASNWKQLYYEALKENEALAKKLTHFTNKQMGNLNLSAYRDANARQTPQPYLPPSGGLGGVLGLWGL